MQQLRFDITYPSDGRCNSRAIDSNEKNEFDSITDESNDDDDADDGQNSSNWCRQMLVSQVGECHYLKVLTFVLALVGESVLHQGTYALASGCHKQSSRSYSGLESVALSVRIMKGQTPPLLTKAARAVACLKFGIRHCAHAPDLDDDGLKALHYTARSGRMGTNQALVQTVPDEGSVAIATARDSQSRT